MEHDVVVMPEKKPFYTSKTLWINAIALLGEFAGLYGTVVSPEERLMVLGFVNLVLRVITKDGLSLS